MFYHVTLTYIVFASRRASHSEKLWPIPEGSLAELRKKRKNMLNAWATATVETITVNNDKVRVRERESERDKTKGKNMFIENISRSHLPVFVYICILLTLSPNEHKALVFLFFFISMYAMARDRVGTNYFRINSTSALRKNNRAEKRLKNTVLNEIPNMLDSRGPSVFRSKMASRRKKMFVYMWKKRENECCMLTPRYTREKTQKYCTLEYW